MNNTVYQEAIAQRNIAAASANMSKMQIYREQLKSISNNLRQMAEAAGRNYTSSNQLLRECYQLTHAELDTYDGWSAKGGQVRKGQHAYLFWGKPTQTSDGKYSYHPILFLFAREQVSFNL